MLVYNFNIIMVYLNKANMCEFDIVLCFLCVPLKDLLYLAVIDATQFNALTAARKN